jgi:hypothetical protein
MEKVKIKRRDQIIVGVNFKDFPFTVASQLKILILVGIAIIIVEDVK